MFQISFYKRFLSFNDIFMKWQNDYLLWVVTRQKYKKYTITVNARISARALIKFFGFEEGC